MSATATASPPTSWSVPINRGQGEYEKPPAGNHHAVLVAIIDLGNQWNQFGTQPGKFQWRGYFVWELLNEKKADGTPHLIATDLTISFNEKAKLAKWIKARTGKDVPESGEFDISTELGQPCFLNVVMDGDWPKIDTMAAVPKGVPTPKPHYQPTAWRLAEYQTSGVNKIPSWAPYFYGSPIGEYVKVSREIAGEEKSKQGVARKSGSNQQSQQSAPANGNGSNGTHTPRPANGPPKPPMPPGAKKEPDPASRWQWCGDGENWNAGTAVEFNTWMSANKTGPDHVYACPEGGTESKLAVEYGFNPIPF